jgi:predicted MFS family arabinose efflux permease
MSSEFILQKVGRRRALTLAIIALIAQLLTYSFLKTPWPALAVQALHGPSFGGLWLSSVSFANRMAPEGMGATAQGLISTVLLGLGASAGSLLGGQLLDMGGTSLAFFWSGVLTVLSLAIVLITRVQDRPALDT